MDGRNLKNPYPGLRPFEQEDSDFFFGRETHTEELLRHNQAVLKENEGRRWGNEGQVFTLRPSTYRKNCLNQAGISSTWT